ncbi:MAG: hypothetical protein M1281_06825 [Chloroflexi bacterium]|nr:hypothetical protein [Chloroflexota bacterium]
MGVIIIPWIIGGLLSAVILVVGTSLVSMWKARDKSSDTGLWQINRRLLVILLILAFLGLVFLVGYLFTGMVIFPEGINYLHPNQFFPFFTPL